jgi:hypothetical protein
MSHAPTCTTIGPASTPKSLALITETTHQHAAPVIRRLRPPPSAPSGLAAPITVDAEWQKSLLGFLTGRTDRPAERRRSAIAAEVEELFAEAQRMPRARR